MLTALSGTTALWIYPYRRKLPDDIYNAFNSGDSTIIAVFFKTSTSADETMDAIKEVRKITDKNCYVTGMSAVVTDLKDLCEHEEPIYVGIAVLLCTVTMMIFMDNWIIPFLFLANIGMAIVVTSAQTTLWARFHM